jgi:hypothetical protein
MATLNCSIASLRTTMQTACGLRGNCADIYVRSIAMHVHANQTNPNAQLDAIYAAARAAANQEAARTRKKLSEFASKLSAALDSGDRITRLGPGEESGEESGRKQKAGADSESAHNSISDWA